MTDTREDTVPPDKHVVADQIAEASARLAQDRGYLDPKGYSDILLKLREIESDEYKNSDYSRFRRARACIEHENILVNHRMTWLLSAHVALFALLGALLLRFLSSDASSNSEAGWQIPIFILVTSILGMFICFNIYISLSNAVGQLENITNWYIRNAKGRDNLNDHFPSIHYWARLGRKKDQKQSNEDNEYSIRARIELMAFETRHIPVYFFTVWFLAGTYAASHTFLRDFVYSVPMMVEKYVYYLLLICFFVIAFLIIILLSRGRRK